MVTVIWHLCEYACVNTERSEQVKQVYVHIGCSCRICSHSISGTKDPSIIYLFHVVIMAISIGNWEHGTHAFMISVTERASQPLCGEWPQAIVYTNLNVSMLALTGFRWTRKNSFTRDAGGSIRESVTNILKPQQ